MYNSNPEPETIKGKPLVNTCRGIRTIWYKGKRVRHQDLPFGESMRGIGPNSKTKTQWNTVRKQDQCLLHGTNAALCSFSDNDHS